MTGCCQKIRNEWILPIFPSKFGYHIGGIGVNMFAYADDVVLLAPSWRALQELIF